jgi:very-short-patch-repair endonuclease
MGYGRGAIDHRLAIGRLHLLYPGVYAVGHADVSLHGRWRAAVLACGAGAVLSHRDAAHLHGFRQSARSAIDVTTAARGRHGPKGITIHRVRFLHPADVTQVQRIPVTTVARTLLDNAEVLNARQFRRAFEESERHRLFDLHAVEALCARSPGRRGLKPLGQLLGERLEPAPSRTEIEHVFFDICRASGIKLPLMNAALLGYVIDALWPEERVAVELDSYEFHRTRADLERDHQRQVALAVAGYRVLRFTWRMVTREPEAVAAAVRAVLLQAA